MRHSNVTGRIRVVKPNYPYSCGRDTELMQTACRLPTDTDTDTELAYIILGLVRPRTVGCLAMASTVQERKVIYADISQRCALTLLVSYKVQYKDRLTRNCDLFTLPTVKAMR